MVTEDYSRIEKAILFLEANFREQPGLKDVAASVGLSEYHFQRLFRRWAGISPKRFLQYLTAEYAKDLLRESQTVLEVAYEVGLSGGSRLHDLCVNIHGVTPGELRDQGAGLAIHYGFHPSPFGECLLAVTERGVCGLTFLSSGGRQEAVARLKSQWQGAVLREDPSTTQSFVERIFAPSRHGVDPALTLFVKGTNFQVKVWEALLRIPMGSVVSYQDVAVSIGLPGAARAVGSAVAQNPVAFLIPCHRVIRKTGAFGDYQWGSARKKAILGWEAAQFHHPKRGAK